MYFTAWHVPVSLLSDLLTILFVADAQNFLLPDGVGLPSIICLFARRLLLPVLGQLVVGHPPLEL